MSIFVEVNSLQPKKCKLIINLESVQEIAPLVTGGCVITFIGQDAGVSRNITVEDSYSQFMQFVMQTVTAESIEKRFPKVKKDIPTIKPQGDKGVELNVPTFGQ